MQNLVRSSRLILFKNKKIHFQLFEDIWIWTQDLNHLRRIIYSFSCSIHWGTQISQYHKTLPTNGTITRLSQTEEYIRQYELRGLNLDDQEAWSKAYLPVVRITNNPRVYEGHAEFQHVCIPLISLNELLLALQKAVYLHDRQHG